MFYLKINKDNNSNKRDIQKVGQNNIFVYRAIHYGDKAPILANRYTDMVLMYN